MFAKTVSVYIYCYSVAQLCLTLCNLMDCSTPGLPVPHRLPSLLSLPKFICIEAPIQGCISGRRGHQRMRWQGGITDAMDMYMHIVFFLILQASILPTH